VINVSEISKGTQTGSAGSVHVASTAGLPWEWAAVTTTAAMNPKNSMNPIDPIANEIAITGAVGTAAGRG
jgi:hypothetical protein